MNLGTPVVMRNEPWEKRGVGRISLIVSEAACYVRWHDGEYLHRFDELKHASLGQESRWFQATSQFQVNLQRGICKLSRSGLPPLQLPFLVINVHDPLEAMTYAPCLGSAWPKDEPYHAPNSVLLEGVEFPENPVCIHREALPQGDGIYTVLCKYGEPVDDPCEVERTPTTRTIQVDMRRMLTDPDYFKKSNEQWESGLRERWKQPIAALETVVYDAICGGIE
jgi:hypothetical protein